MGEFGIFVKSFVVYKRKVLTIQRSNYNGFGNGEWDIPGGGLQFGESPLECLEREIREEAGLTVCIDRLLYALSVINPTRQNVGLFYLGYSDSDNVTLSHEHSHYLWATKKELVELMSKSVFEDYVKNSVFEILDID